MNQEKSFRPDNLASDRSKDTGPGPPGRFWGPEPDKNLPALNKTRVRVIFRLMN